MLFSGPEGAVLVAAVNLTGSNPRDFTVELVIRRNVGETCIVDGTRHLHDLRTVASGNTVSGLTAAQVTGRVVHVQEQSLTLLVVVLAVNGQLTPSRSTNRPGTPDSSPVNQTPGLKGEYSIAEVVST